MANSLQVMGLETTEGKYEEPFKIRKMETKECLVEMKRNICEEGIKTVLQSSKPNLKKKEVPSHYNFFMGLETTEGKHKEHVKIRKMETKGCLVERKRDHYEEESLGVVEGMKIAPKSRIPKLKNKKAPHNKDVFDFKLLE